MLALPLRDARRGRARVERPLAGMETAFRATLRRRGRTGRPSASSASTTLSPAVRPDGRTEAVHSCGHGPIAGGVTGAALALASLARRARRARSSVIGCPADEIHAPGTIVRGGGKALTAEAGVWDDIDAALYAHPEFIDTVSVESRWLRRATAIVPGSRVLASADQPPYAAAVAALEEARRHVPDNVMLERLELDGDVEEATGLVTKATFLLFGDEEQEVEAGLTAVRAALPRRDLGDRPPVRGGAAGRARDRGCRRGVPGARARLRLRPAAAAIRDGLREHLATVSGGADRRRPPGWLEVPHGRGRGGVRLGGRRGGGDDGRAGARARGARDPRSGRLSPAGRASPRARERKGGSRRPASPARVARPVGAASLSSSRGEARGELPRQLLGDAADDGAAVLRDSALERQLGGDVDPRSSVDRRERRADRRLGAAAPAHLARLDRETLRAAPPGRALSAAPRIGTGARSARASPLQHLPCAIVDRPLERRSRHARHDARDVLEQRPGRLQRRHRPRSRSRSARTRI